MLHSSDKKQKRREADIAPEKLPPGAPPPAPPYILVTLIEDSRQVIVAALVKADDGCLISLGPYNFETDDPAENEALGLQAAAALHAKYGAEIYIQPRPYRYLS